MPNLETRIAELEKAKTAESLGTIIIVRFDDPLRPERAMVALCGGEMRYGRHQDEEEEAFIDRVKASLPEKGAVRLLFAEYEDDTGP